MPEASSIAHMELSKFLYSMPYSSSDKYVTLGEKESITLPKGRDVYLLMDRKQVFSNDPQYEWQAFSLSEDAVLYGPAVYTMSPPSSRLMLALNLAMFPLGLFFLASLLLVTIFVLNGAVNKVALAYLYGCSPWAFWMIMLFFLEFLNPSHDYKSSTVNVAKTSCPGKK